MVATPSPTSADQLDLFSTRAAQEAAQPPAVIHQAASPASSELARQAAAATTRRRGGPPVRFRNPATGETWTGRGLKPRWVAHELAAGKTLADFEVMAC